MLACDFEASGESIDLVNLSGVEHIKTVLLFCKIFGCLSPITQQHKF